MSQQKILLRWMAYSAFANALLSFSSFAIYMFMSNVWYYTLLESTQFHTPENVPGMVFEILYRNHYWLFVILESIKFFLCFSQWVLSYGFYKWLQYSPMYLKFLSSFFVILSIFFLFLAGFIALTFDWAWEPPQHSDFFFSSYRLFDSKIITQFSMISITLMGVWHLIINAQALWNRQLPKALAIIGIVLGTVNLFVIPLPPMAMLTLLFSLVWMIWLGVFLLKVDNQNTPHPSLADPS